MQNPILGMIGKSQMMGNLDKFKQMMNMVKNANNPQAMFQQMLSNNQQYNQVMQIIQENGGDAQKAFYAMADKMGVNGDEIINALTLK